MRFYYLIIRNIFVLPGVIKKMRQMVADGGYSEAECFDYLKYIIDTINRTGHIQVEAYGKDKLPKEGGYVMYPNHQGKYDGYGIVCAHEKPCTVVMDREKSYDIFINEIIGLIKGKRLDKEDVRQALTVIYEIAKEVEQGRKYILFPEGGYDRKKKNSLREFKAGCFKASVKSKTPIVPVVLVDSYKAMNSAKPGKVTVQIHFLDPICYEEYQGMKTAQIAAMVKGKIHQKLDALGIITE